MASLWLEQSGRHSLAFGRPRKIWKTHRGFQFWREGGGLIKLIGVADTLPTEDFLEVEDLSEGLKKVWRRPAAPLLRLAIIFGLSAQIKETPFLHHIDIQSEKPPPAHLAESPEPPDGLGGREPLRGAHYCQPPRLCGPQREAFALILKELVNIIRIV